MVAIVLLCYFAMVIKIVYDSGYGRRMSGGVKVEGLLGCLARVMTASPLRQKFADNVIC